MIGMGVVALALVVLLLLAVTRARNTILDGIPQRISLWRSGI
jgi:hypothetical protein